MRQFDNPGGKTFFFHIVKTGGVTFRTMLTSLYQNDFEICYDPTVESIEAGLKTARAMEFHAFQFKGRLTYMHQELARLERWDLLDGHNVFAMVREPVDQAVSLFYYLQRKRLRVEKVYTSYGVAFPETFEQFLESPHHFNTQTSFLAGRHQLAGEAPLGWNDLARATQLIQRLNIHMGLTDRYAESVSIFESVTGKRLHGELKAQNQNLDRPPLSQIPDRIQQAIRERSALDLELYEHGRELFHADLARIRPERRYVFTSVPQLRPQFLAESQVA